MVRDSGNPDLSLWVQALRLFLELDSTLQLHSSGPGLLEVRHFQTGRNTGILIPASLECEAKVSLMRQVFEAVGGDGGARPQACSPEPGSISQWVHEPPRP